jgi:hypothetical protein
VIQKLVVPYATWAQVAQNNALSTFHRLDGDEAVTAWCGTTDLLYRAEVGAEDHAAWVAAFPSSTAVVGEHDAIAYIVGLAKAYLDPRDENDARVLAPTFENTGGLHPQWEGHLYTATAGATNIFDEVITVEKSLRGGWYEVFSATASEGDYIEFAVVDKDDTLGLFGALGYTAGVDVLELKKYVKKAYVNPLVTGRREVYQANSVFTVVAGLYLRTIYESIGATDVVFKTEVIAYE